MRRITLRTSLYFNRRSPLTTIVLSGFCSWMSLSMAGRPSGATKFCCTKTLPSDLTETVTSFWLSGIFAGSAVWGSVTAMPFWSIGVTTMKMISSTRQTSTRGVTLISPRTPGSEIGLRFFLGSIFLLLLHEKVDQLGGGVRHLHLEPLELVLEEVEHPGGRNGHEQTESRGDEGFRDTGGDGADATRAGEGHAAKGVDDADHRSEQPDEGGGGGD